jgi:hypothetical protein
MRPYHLASRFGLLEVLVDPVPRLASGRLPAAQHPNRQLPSGRVNRCDRCQAHLRITREKAVDCFAADVRDCKAAVVEQFPARFIHVDDVFRGITSHDFRDSFAVSFHHLWIHVRSPFCMWFSGREPVPLHETLPPVASRFEPSLFVRSRRNEFFVVSLHCDVFVVA